jgi:hypothetical protein
LNDAGGKLANWKSLCAIGLSIVGVAALTSCGPLNIPYINVYGVDQPQNKTHAAFGLNGANFPKNTKYNIGIFTNGAPRMIGQIQTDYGGYIESVTIEYTCQTRTQPSINVELYIINGPGIATRSSYSPLCM